MTQGMVERVGVWAVYSGDKIVASTRPGLTQEEAEAFARGLLGEYGQISIHELVPITAVRESIVREMYERCDYTDSHYHALRAYAAEHGINLDSTQG